MLHLRLIYNFSKDTNSTKHPFDSGSVYSYSAFDCEVYEPCTFHNPIFILQSNAKDYLMRDYAYAYVQEWKACYWVTEREFAEGRILIHCELDALATYRTAIMNSSQYVLRSASFQNENIVDLEYPVIGPKQQLASVLASASNPFKTNISDGVFVMGVTSKAAAAGSSLGTTFYISMGPSEMTAFSGALMNNDSWLNISASELSSDMVKVILNPIQYIQSIKWFPLAPTAARDPNGTKQTSLPIGWWNITTDYYKAFAGSNQVVQLSFELVVPKHPQAAIIGQYLNYDPFSNYKLRLPIIGELDLPSRVGDADKVVVIYDIDIPSGLANVTVNSVITTPATTFTEATFTTSVAVDVPLSQILKDEVGAVKSAVSTVANAVGAITGFSTNNIGSGLYSAANAVNSAIDTAIKVVQPVPSFIGTTGHVGAYKAVDPALYLNYSPVADPDIGLFGSPLCQVKTLSTCSGITVIASPHIEIPGASKQDLEYIETIMSTGIRLE